MKQFTLTALIFVSASLLSSATFAHALLKDESTQVPTPHNWTGIYAGLNAGLVQRTMNITDNQASSFNATIQQTVNPRFTGGFQVGYRHQLAFSNSSGVFGLEFSDNFSNAKFNQEYGSPFALYQLSSENKLKNLALLQFIGGITADKTLLFLSAGGSWANISGLIQNIDGVPFFNALNVGKKVLSPAIGGGVDYAFSRKISARFKLDVILSKAYSTLDNAGNSYQISNNIVQGTFGVNYTFG